MKARFVSVLAFAAALFALHVGAAQAQSVYLGVNGGVSGWNVDWAAGPGNEDKTGSGYRIYGGYNFNDDIGVEAFAIDLGKTSKGIAEVKAKGYGVAGAYNLHFGSRKEWVMIARVGVVSIEAEGMNTTNANGKKTAAQLLGGIGIGYSPNKNFMLRADLDGTAAETTDGQRAGVSLLSLGVTISF
jgi:OOP family OmpA-OmpF porin